MQAWRFVVLRSPEMRAVVAEAAARALEVIEPVYGMSRPAPGDDSHDATLARCLQAAMWAPSGANMQAWRFVVLRSPDMRAVVAEAAARALEVIEPVYGMSRPAPGDDSRRARSDRATYELHDRAGEHASVLFAQQSYPTASDLLVGGSIFPAVQNFLLVARAQGLRGLVEA